MGKANFHDPAKPTPINRSTPHLVRLITSSIPPTLPNFVTIGCWGSSGQWGEIYTFLCRFFFFFSPSNPTSTSKYGPIFVVNTSTDVFPCIFVHRLETIYTNPILGGHLPPKPPIFAKSLLFATWVLNLNCSPNQWTKGRWERLKWRHSMHVTGLGDWNHRG